MTDTAIATQEQRDDAIAEALTAGRSVRSIRKQFKVSTSELDAVLERLWPLDLQSRIRMIATDLAILSQLTEVFVAKALAGDVPSSLCVIRVLERKHELLGMNSAAKVEIIQAPREAPDEFDQVFDAVMRVARRPNGGDGAVDVPAVPDATNGGSSDPQ